MRQWKISQSMFFCIGANKLVHRGKVSGISSWRNGGTAVLIHSPSSYWIHITHQDKIIGSYQWGNETTQLIRQGDGINVFTFQPGNYPRIQCLNGAIITEFS